MPIAPAIIGAGAALGGGILSGIFGASQASKNRDFQRFMSNTAYQRAVRDMRRAGLNPALAYQQGGASTPGGDSARLGNIGEDAVQGASIAQGVANSKMMTKAEVAQRMASADYTTAQADQLRLESTLRVLNLSNSADLKQMGIWQGRENLRYLRETLADRVRAVGLGNTATAAQTRAWAAGAYLDELAAPRAKNEAAAQRSWWMKNAAPFFNFFTGGARAATPFLRR